jgi:hypothetical protein
MMKTFLILHFLGMTAGGGTAMFMALLGLRMHSAGGMEKGMVNLHAFKATILGEIGLVMLIVSGLAMAALNPALLAAPLYWSKMVMVVLLTVFMAILRRTAGRLSRGEMALAKKMPGLGIMVLALWLIVVITAVLAYG